MNLDDYDSRVSLFNEEAFEYGINFHAKVFCPSNSVALIVIHEYRF